MNNYKSFYNKTEISMIAENGKQEYKDRLLNIKSDLNKKVLPVMAIYGANASGKTSIISAINLLKQIVINGTIKKQINNDLISKLDISAFIHDVEKLYEPIHLEIKFKTDMYIYNYIIEIIATYIDNTRKIVNEELNIIEYVKNGSSIKEKSINLYKRTDKQVFLNSEKDALNILEYKNNLSELGEIFSNNLDNEDLFLTTGFKSMINLKIETDILNWFQEKVITEIDFYSINFEDSDDNSDKVYQNKILNKLIKFADFGPQEIGYIKDNDGGKFSLCSFYKTSGAKKGLAIDSKDIESKGTIKVIDFCMGFINYFNEGGIFILDEFDSSIHPELVGGIIDLFNNPEINTHNAQLIFNTHNPLYLQKRFFRRDQIMFVEKDRDTYISNVYKLSEFDVRNDRDYMKSYFEGRFGALPFIDFESALLETEESD